VVEGFAADLAGFQRDGELLLGFFLPDEFAEARGAELQLEAWSSSTRAAETSRSESARGSASVCLGDSLRAMVRRREAQIKSQLRNQRSASAGN